MLVTESGVWILVVTSSYSFWLVVLCFFLFGTCFYIALDLNVVASYYKELLVIVSTCESPSIVEMLNYKCWDT